MVTLQESCRSSADLRNYYEEYKSMKAGIELLEILLEAEDDVKNGRVAPISETFDDLEKSILALGDIHM